uniref:Innexin n=1 Tax=Globodera rostochiensis TaxID=31243 RepID=A0A914HTL3_GLORO
MDATLKKFIAGVRKEHDDDVVDRAVYATSVYILGFFAVLIMAKQYVGDPLQCWLPAEYTGAWERYIENYCFVENTYYVAQNQSSKMLSPEHKSARRHYELRYYQWIPYILSVQALICYAPKMIFKILYSFTDLRVSDLIRLAYRGTKSHWEDGTLSKRIAQKLIARKEAKALISFNWYLTFSYLLMKSLFVLALSLQLFIINFSLATFNPLWGFTIIWKIAVDGDDWRNNGFFPRVTFCDLKTRDIGQSREHTVQCVLMINMFAEKIFIFLWLWFFVFFVISCLNLLFWIHRIFSMRSKETMIFEALRLQNVRPNRQNVRIFISNFLKLDGIVVLRLIDANTGHIHMADIAHHLKWTL